MRTKSSWKLIQFMQLRKFLGATVMLSAAPAAAQTAIDRVDPARIERENLPKPAADPERPVVVQSGRASGAAPTATAIDVGAIVFDGMRGLAPADFSDIVARYIGRSLSGDELSRLAEEIASRARGRGYVFASAWIEPQRLTSGILTIRYDAGVLDDVRIEGDDNAAVRAALAPLLGEPAVMDQVERRLLLAGDIDGVSIRRSEFVRENGRGILVVRVVARPLRVRMVLENDSTAPIGPEQLRIDADVNALFASDDSFTVTYVTTPFEPDELQYVRGRYSKRISADGTEVSLSAAASSTHPGAYLDRLDIDGDSWSGSVDILQPLQRRRDGSLWFRGALDLRDSQSRRAGQLRRHDRIFAVRVSLYGNQKAGGGLLRGNLTLSRGLDGLGATRSGDPLASRDDADGTFTNLVGWMDWTRPLGDGLSLKIAARGQIAAEPQLVAEEIGIGGSSFLRGYDYSERSGDQGVMASAELRYDWRRPFGLPRKAQLYGFVDGGEVSSLANGKGGGSLASGGGGVRADVSPSIDANVEIAVPLSGPRYETGTTDPRVNFRILKIF